MSQNVDLIKTFPSEKIYHTSNKHKTKLLPTERIKIKRSQPELKKSQPE